MDPQVVDGLLLYGVLLISLVFHEASHALFGLLGGDRTAYLGGQVTLNPIPHIRREPFGTVILPIGMLVLSNFTMCMGFAHAPYDPVWAYHHPKRAALMSAAGPLANLFLAGVALLFLKILVLTELAEPNYHVLQWLWPTDGSGDGPLFAAIRIASVFVYLNVVLAILNLIPFPPFDGAGVVEGLFPKTRGFFDLVRGNLVLIIVLMILIFRYLHFFYLPILQDLKDWLG